MANELLSLFQHSKTSSLQYSLTEIVKNSKQFNYPFWGKYFREKLAAVKMGELHSKGAPALGG
jgi:hypothetical protein